MSSRTFCQATTDHAVIADAVAYHVRHCVAEIREMGQLAQRVSVQVRPSRHGAFMFRGGSKEAVLTAPSADTTEFLAIASRMLIDLLEPGVLYHKAGVQLGLFSPATHQQQSLFSTTKSQKKEEIMAVVDSLNAQTGKEIVLMGSHLQGEKWQARAEVRSPAYTTRWKELATVWAK